MARRLLAVTLLVACGGGGGESADAPRASDGSAAIDARADAAPDAPAAPDPWTQPVGSALAGVTLSDGWTDLRELPAPMAFDGGWTDSLFATPDGQHLRFAYARMDFFDFYISSGSDVELTGPVIAGSAQTSFKLYDATLTAAGWTLAYDPVNDPDPDLVEASPASNTSDDLLVFSEFAGAQASLYYSAFGSSQWSPPAEVPINDAPCNTDNAKIVGDLSTSVDLFFESNRGSGSGAPCSTQRTLYQATYDTATGFSAVTPMPGISGSDTDDSQPFLAPGEQTMYFTSIRAGQFGVFTATKQGSAWVDVHAVATATVVPPFTGNVTLLGEPSVVSTPSGELLYMMCGIAEDLHGAHTYEDADFIALRPCVARRPH